MSGKNLDMKQCISDLDAGQWGTLAVFDRPFPYQMPVNYAFVTTSSGSQGQDPVDACKLYFHTRPGGTLDQLASEGTTASFCLVSKAQPIREEPACDYRQVGVLGFIHPVNDPMEKAIALQLLTMKYGLVDEAQLPGAACRHPDSTSVFALEISELSGREHAAG